MTMGPLEKGSGHNFTNLSLIVATILTFIITTIFNGLAGSGAGVPLGIFYSTVGNLSAKYELFITPAGWTFSIWSVIYLWLACGLLGLAVSLGAKTSDGRVYLRPAVATPKVTATLSINFICNLVWIFLWDREQIVGASVFLFLIAITNIVSLGFFLKNVEDNSQKFCRGSPTFYWGLAYRLTANGLGIYTSWTVIASLINFTTAIHYSGGVPMLASCLVSLSLLHLLALSWFLLSTLVVSFSRCTRYLYTPFLVLVWAAAGVLSKKYNDHNVPNEIKDFVLATLVVGAALFVLSVVEKVYRTVKGKYDTIELLQ